MKTVLVLTLCLVALGFGAPVAAAEPGPCGPNVQYCQPFEPCRNPQNIAMEIVCHPEQIVPVLP